MKEISRDGNLSLTVSQDGAYYVMAGGRYGTHRLAVSSTSPKRLHAHWIGYCQNSR